MSYPPNIGPGMLVHFRSESGKAPYAPFFNRYQGHTFSVVARKPGGHVELVCIDEPWIKVDGYVDADLLKLA